MQPGAGKGPVAFGGGDGDVEKPGGLDALIEQVKARHDWVRQEEAQYSKGPLSIGVLAHRVGMDTIEVGAGLASHGIRLKVATGNLQERDAADKAVRLSARRLVASAFRSNPVQVVRRPMRRCSGKS